MPKKQTIAIPPPKLTDEQKQAGVVAIAAAGGTSQDIAEFAAEHALKPETLRQLAEGLEDHAKCIRQAAQRLQPAAIDDEEE